MRLERLVLAPEQAECCGAANDSNRPEATGQRFRGIASFGPIFTELGMYILAKARTPKVRNLASNGCYASVDADVVDRALAVTWPEPGSPRM